MRFEDVSKRYQETNRKTLPMIDYLLKLLESSLDRIVNCKDMADVIEQRESLVDVQNILFELMAMTDQSHDEGKRLFTAYIYLNQCIVKFRVGGDVSQLELVEAHLLRMIESWKIVKHSRPFKPQI